MKKYIIILFSMLLLASSTVDAQINPIKRGSSSSKKTERTQKKSETKTGKEKKKTVQKQKRSSTDSEEVKKELTELGLTDPAEAWSFNSNVFRINIHVQFTPKKISITHEERVNVERIASYMKHRPTAVCVIKGYASPEEGSLDQANLLAGNRVANVRDMLVNKYGIESNRIQVFNMGISNMFDVLSWNRVAICEIFSESKTMNRISNPYAEHMNYLVQFNENSTNVKNDQEIFVIHVAQFLVSHPEATCAIYGYAHPAEGALDDINRLANDRATSVKNLLVTKYGISFSRITTQGCGASNMFDEHSWNSFAFCEIHTKE